MAVLDENGVQRLWNNTVALVESEKEIVRVSGVFNLADNSVTNLSHTFEQMLTAYQAGKTLKCELYVPLGGAYGSVFDYNISGVLSCVVTVDGAVYGFVFKVMFKGDLGYGDFLYYNTLTIDVSGNTTVETSIVNTLV